MKRGQASFEYLILVGFVTLIISGIFAVALFYTNNSQDNVRITQVTNFANKIISSSESMFYAGEPSKTTITAFLPENVKNITIAEDTLIITVQISSGLNVIGFPSKVNITGDITHTPGIKKIVIAAQEDKVLISQP